MRILLLLAFLGGFVSDSLAQISESRDSSGAEGAFSKPGAITIDWISGDTTSMSGSDSRGFSGEQFLRYFSQRAVFKPFWSVDSLGEDSTRDSLIAEFSYRGLGIKRKRDKNRLFLISEIENPRQTSYLESFHMMEFNRVDGFFMGLGSSSMADFGPHDEIGINGGFGFGFGNERWQYFMGGEYRIPLTPFPPVATDSAYNGRKFYTPATLAVGAEFHNRTSTADLWRAGKGENSLYAFFAREDFRDYYKLAGWSGYLAYRPLVGRELRAEWRSDTYESREQTVFYGRWGGNKRLPVNPPVLEGQLNALVFTYQAEHVQQKDVKFENLFGDSVRIDRVSGQSTLLQTELGHMPGNVAGFNRYTLDLRSFRPIVNGLNIDSRLRFEAGTGDLPAQKAQYLGGPSSLPAMANKELAGNRLLLLNTELRLHLSALSTFFSARGMQIVLSNDFGWIGRARKLAPIHKSAEPISLRTIDYNVGIGIGSASGLQIGAAWRTDRSESPRFIFRLQRPF